ncbi:MAG: phloretin hydrolase [Anaerostipes sp.]|nr:phloretin hydrolase [Anaerostipes sp.]
MKGKDIKTMMTSDYLTSVERALSYSKYFFRDSFPPTDRQALALDNPLNESDMLSIEHRNKLLDSTPVVGDTGYGIFKDGTGYVANVTSMPNVTPEMFYWWFAWHPLEDLRYKIWFPEAHFYARTMNREQALDETLSMRHRIWDTTHLICENVVTGAEDIVLDFLSPDRMGFDESLLDEHTTAMVCANGHPKFPGQGLNCVMAHVLRQGNNGYELRSQFWIGYQIVNRNLCRVIPEDVSIPLEGAKALFSHCCEEFSNLSRFLPSLYEEESPKPFLP